MNPHVTSFCPIPGRRVPPMAVALVAGEHIGRAGRSAETAMDATPQDRIGAGDGRIGELDVSETGLHGPRPYPWIHAAGVENPHRIEGGGRHQRLPLGLVEEAFAEVMVRYFYQCPPRREPRSLQRRSSRTDHIPSTCARRSCAVWQPCGFAASARSRNTLQAARWRPLIVAPVASALLSSHEAGPAPFLCNPCRDGRRA